MKFLTSNKKKHVLQSLSPWFPLLCASWRLLFCVLSGLMVDWELSKAGGAPKVRKAHQHQLCCPTLGALRQGRAVAVVPPSDYSALPIRQWQPPILKTGDVTVPGLSKMQVKPSQEKITKAVVPYLAGGEGTSDPHPKKSHRSVVLGTLASDLEMASDLWKWRDTGYNTAWLRGLGCKP